VQAKDLRSSWPVRHYYTVLGIAGIAMFVLAYPVSNLFRLSPEEYRIMAEYAFEHDMKYKGKDFLEWRYGWFNVVWYMIIGGFLLIGSAICLRVITNAKVRRPKVYSI
jgi:hypothetical protein